VWLHVLRRPGADAFGVLLHFAHAVMDGTGAKMVVSGVLRRFALLLAGDATCDGEDVPAESKREWGAEVERLSPCISQILDESVGRPGDPRVEQTLLEVVTCMGTAVPFFCCTEATRAPHLRLFTLICPRAEQPRSQAPWFRAGEDRPGRTRLYSCRVCRHDRVVQGETLVAEPSWSVHLCVDPSCAS